MSRSRTILSIRAVLLQIAALSALGLGQPLLQLVRENPEFLTVHHSQGWDVVILTAVLLLLLPVILTVVVFIVSRISPVVGTLLQSAILGSLVTLLLLPVLDRIPRVAGWLTLGLGSTAGIVFAFGFSRSRFIRQNLAILALVLPVFLLLFLASAPIRVLLRPAEPSVPAPDRPVVDPVVMIIFDELPASSLMTPAGELDCQLFPNFCRLAAQSTWYRNATTISGATLRSVPVITSGKLPNWKETPSFADHPDNIFSLLAASHRISALEVQTSLCPAELKSEKIPRLTARLELLLVDLGVLYQHIVVPEKWRDRLVPVSDKWGNFLVQDRAARGAAREEARIEQFEEFVASLEVGEKPNLVVAHILLPHSPFQFLPDGRIYNWRRKIPALPDGIWGTDTEVIAHSYRRHLLQVAAVDRLLGMLLDRLHDLGILEDTAIVVTADHGISFKAGLPRRRFTDAIKADVMFVPLFIKLPHQVTGKIDDRFIQSLDIMPTLASALGCELGWASDGMDLSTAADDREDLLFMDQDAGQERRFGFEIRSERDAVIAWKQELFGTQGSIERLFNHFDPGGFIGREVAGLVVRPHREIRGRILDAQELENVDLSGHFVPAELNGTIEDHAGDGRLTLVLAINGKVAGATRSYLESPEPGIRTWQITVSPEVFRDGANQAELFVVDEVSSDVDLLEIPLFTPSFLGTNLGGTKVSGIEESGLFGSHDWGGRMARWTNGAGRWTIPIRAGEKPKTLTIGIVNSGPPGTELSVTVNGKQLLNQFLPEGAWENQLPLNKVEFGKKLTVELRSSVFVPAEVNSRSNDRRELGVAVTTLVVK